MSDQHVIRPSNHYFVRESTRDTLESNPDWLRYSDEVVEVSIPFNPQKVIRRMTGSPHPQGVSLAQLDAQCSITYRMQNWFEDGSTNALDASYDGIQRNTDNQLPNTHSMWVEEVHNTGGNDSNGVRFFAIGTGGRIDTVTITGNPDEPDIELQVDYIFKKLVPYVIHQPTSAQLSIVSDDSNDTMDITVEDDAGTSETLTLTGTSAVTTTKTDFASLAGAFLTAKPEGTITIDDGSTTTYMTIQGASSYDSIDGDLGVPVLGSGSEESALGTDPENFLAHSIERPNGTAWAEKYDEAEITIENNVQQRSLGSDTREMDVEAGSMRSEVTGTVFGETEVHDTVVEGLQISQENLDYIFEGGTLRFPNAELEDPGEVTYDDGDDKVTTGVQYVALGEPSIDP